MLRSGLTTSLFAKLRKPPPVNRSPFWRQTSSLARIALANCCAVEHFSTRITSMPALALNSVASVSKDKMRASRVANSRSSDTARSFLTAASVSKDKMRASRVANSRFSDTARSSLTAASVSKDKMRASRVANSRFSDTARSALAPTAALRSSQDKIAAEIANCRFSDTLRALRPQCRSPV